MVLGLVLCAVFAATKGTAIVALEWGIATLALGCVMLFIARYLMPTIWAITLVSLVGILTQFYFTFTPTANWRKTVAKYT